MQNIFTPHDPDNSEEPDGSDDSDDDSDNSLQKYDGHRGAQPNVVPVFSPLLPIGRKNKATHPPVTLHVVWLNPSKICEIPLQTLILSKYIPSDPPRKKKYRTALLSQNFQGVYYTPHSKSFLAHLDMTMACAL